MTAKELTKTIEALRKISDSEWRKIKKMLLESETKTETVSDREKEVAKILKNLGIPANIKGYRYGIRGILITIEHPGIPVTRELYPMIAKEFNTTPSRVERALRHAIEVACDRGDEECFEKIFESSISSKRGKPTNSEFIFTIADYLVS